MKTAVAQPHRLNTPERCRRLRTRGRGSESRSELRAPELRCLVSSLPRSRRETALTEWLWADLSKKKGWWALSPNKKNGYGPGLQVVGLGLSLWPKIASRVRAESPNLRAGAEHTTIAAGSGGGETTAPPRRRSRPPGLITRDTAPESFPTLGLLRRSLRRSRES